MDDVSYFKSQAKFLLKDVKTRFYFAQYKRYDYMPKTFNLMQLFRGLGIDDSKDEFTFTLMNAQHVIAIMAGFHKWNELISVSKSDLRIARIIYAQRKKDAYFRVIQSERRSDDVFSVRAKRMLTTLLSEYVSGLDNFLPRLFSGAIRSMDDAEKELRYMQEREVRHWENERLRNMTDEELESEILGDIMAEAYSGGF